MMVLSALRILPLRFLLPLPINSIPLSPFRPHFLHSFLSQGSDVMQSERGIRGACDLASSCLILVSRQSIPSPAPLSMEQIQMEIKDCPNGSKSRGSTFLDSLCYHCSLAQKHVFIFHLHCTADGNAKNPPPPPTPLSVPALAFARSFHQW